MATKSLLFIYGSETGTAQDLAESLWQHARLRKLPARVLSLDDYNIKTLNEEICVIFVIATAGQGEMPTSCRKAWRILCHKLLPSNLLTGVHIAVLGLGDSSYQNYNFAGKKLFRRLLQLGADPLVDLMLADGQQESGVEEALETFRNAIFLQIFVLRLFKAMVLHPDSSECLPPRFQIVYCDQVPTSSVDVKNQEKLEFQLFRVGGSERVTALEHFQETRLLKLTPTGSEVRYNPGSVILIQPFNLPESVNMAVRVFGYNDELLDRRVYLKPTDKSIRRIPPWLLNGLRFRTKAKLPNMDASPLSISHNFLTFKRVRLLLSAGVQVSLSFMTNLEPTTLRDCLIRYFDLQMVPRRSFFKMLSHLSHIHLEKEKLEELASWQDDGAYIEYCIRPRRTIAEALRDFEKTVKGISPEKLFDLLKPIKPRAYSIASCHSKHSHVELLVAKVEYKVKNMCDLRRGLCSTFLSRLRCGDEVFAKIQDGTFKWPNERCGLLLVGPGTGVAAFRSILNFRDMKFKDNCAKAVLFFGCRGETKDFYFSEEWGELKKLRVITAFSRDNSHKKEHVQDKIKQFSDEVWDVINLNTGYVFIAGRNGEMPQAVIGALKNVFSLNGRNGDEMLALLKTEGRFQIETWD